MLRTLSRRNAKRQVTDYVIYIMTLVITVALLLSFNMIIFSKEIDAVIKEKSILPLMIIGVSMVVVVIMSTLVNYITIFMLKRRGKEFGLYMLLGIDNKCVAKMFVNENLLIYKVVLLVGLIVGTLFFQIVKLLVINMYSIPYKFMIEISWKAILLTLFYMSMIFGLASLKVSHVIEKMSVQELLYIEKCEKGDEDIGSKKNAITALISIIFGLLGCGIIVLSTIKQISDSWNFFAIILLMFFSYSFFYKFLKIIFLHLKNGKWKYHKKRFFISRQITSKMVPNISLFTGVTMAMTLALFAINWGIYFSNKVDERVNAVAFDVAFFNEEENTDFSSFLSFLNKKNELVNSYEYNLYTNYENSFYLETQKKIRGKFEFTISSTENDVFMSETDYVNLRSILDLKPIMLADDEYILQCTSSNVEALELYVQKKPNLKIGNSYYRIRNIYSENFMQQEVKGNGEGVLIVVPDNVINDLSFYMNVLAVKTKSNLSLVEINNMKNIDDKSYIVSKAGVRSQSASMAIYAVVPLFYLAIVIIAMICTVLSIQILSEAKKDIRSCKILTYLGMEEKEYKKILKKQLAILYFLPAVPAMLINVIIFPISVSGTVRKANGMLHIVGVWQGMKQLGITIIIFVIFLFLYYFVTYKLYLKICHKECVQ